MLAQAAQAADAGNLRQAVDILEVYNERKPGNADVVEQLAFTYGQMNDPLPASLYFSQLSQLRGGEPIYLLYAAQSLVDAGDASGAIRGYQDYLTVRPEDTGAWVALGELAANSGRAEVAINAYTRAHTLKPGPRSALRLGQLYLAQGNLAVAGQWLDTAAKAPDAPMADVLLAQLELALRHDQPEVEEALVQRLQTEFPGTIEQSRLSGVPARVAEWRAGQDEIQRKLEALRAREAAEAEEAARKAAEETAAAQAAQQASGEDPVGTLEPTEVEPGRLLDKESAIVRMERPAPQQPQDNTALAEARAARELGDTATAARLYRSALATSESAELYNEYSTFSAEAGNPQAAMGAALEALRLDPENAAYAMHYLSVAKDVQSGPRFLRELEQMQARFPDSPDILLTLARAYWRIGNNARNARLLYDRFIESYPNHPLIAQARGERAQLPK